MKKKDVKCPVCKGKRYLVTTKVEGRRKGTLIPQFIRITGEVCPHCHGKGKLRSL